MRPPFLILTPVSVLLGYAVALLSSQQVQALDLCLAVLGGLSAHISVNLLNEYFDFTSGLDASTQKTPFSGGSGALPADPNSAKAVLGAGIISLAITLSVGLYYGIRLGGTLAPIGGLGVLLILTYTRWLNRYPLLCLFAPGIGFGPLMVVGTHLALTSEYSTLAWLVSLLPLFLVNNLLLLNQLPDIEADKRVGRRHFPIAYGIAKSLWVYAVFVLMAALVIPFGVLFNLLPTLSYLSLIPLFMSIWVYFGVKQQAHVVPKLLPYLAVNVLITLVTPTVLALTLLWA